LQKLNGNRLKISIVKVALSRKISKNGAHELENQDKRRKGKIGYAPLKDPKVRYMPTMVYM